MKKILFCLFCMTFYAHTGRADLYQVSDIPVSAELSNAIEAREVALANGQVEAFWKLMRKMTVDSELQKVPLLNQDKVINLVHNVSIADEKTTATKYMGILSVSFKPKEIQNFLVQNQIPFLMQEPPPYLVIPVLKKGDQIVLLDDSNPVFSFIKQVKNENPIFDFKIPEGTTEEKLLVQMLWENRSETGWKPLLEKYQAERVLFFAVEQVGPSVTVRTWSLPMDKETLEQYAFQMMVPTGDIVSVLPRLWDYAIQSIEKAWRKAKTNDLTTPGVFWVSFPIQNLREWQVLFQQLRKASFLNDVRVRAFRPREVLMALKYKGTGEQLSENLNEIGLAVQPVFGQGAWRLIRLPQYRSGEEK